MKRTTGAVLAALILFGCARHVVVERDSGTVDGAKSITSQSDPAWAIESEPAGGTKTEPAPEGAP